MGNTARALVKFGYEDDPKVRSAFQWLVKNQKPNGGWDCFGRDGVIDGWEGMSAFAAYPRGKWTRGMKEAVDALAKIGGERALDMIMDTIESKPGLGGPLESYGSQTGRTRGARRSRRLSASWDIQTALREACSPSLSLYSDTGD